MIPSSCQQSAEIARLVSLASRYHDQLSMLRIGRIGVVALPLWSDNQLEGATRTQAGAVLWVVIIMAVIPWRHVLAQYVMAPGEPWRRSR